VTAVIAGPCSASWRDVAHAIENALQRIRPRPGPAAHPGRYARRGRCYLLTNVRRRVGIHVVLETLGSRLIALRDMTMVPAGCRRHPDKSTCAPIGRRSSRGFPSAMSLDEPGSGCDRLAGLLQIRRRRGFARSAAGLRWSPGGPEQKVAVRTTSTISGGTVRIFAPARSLSTSPRGRGACPRCKAELLVEEFQGLIARIWSRLPRCANPQLHTDSVVCPAHRASWRRPTASKARILGGTHTHAVDDHQAARRQGSTESCFLQSRGRQQPVNTERARVWSGGSIVTCAVQRQFGAVLLVSRDSSRKFDGNGGTGRRPRRSSRTSRCLCITPWLVKPVTATTP